jgi:hypothetical protein
MTRLLTAVTLAVCWAGLASAHKPSDSYLTVRADGTELVGQWDIALRDLDYAIGLDADGDGTLTWGELRARHAAIAAYALARLEVAADGAVCSSRPTAHLVDRHSDGGYAVLRFTLDCPSTPFAGRRAGAAGADGGRASMEIHYRLFFDFDAQHRGLLQLAAGATTHTLRFSADQTMHRFDLAPTAASPALGRGMWHTFSDFWRDGVWHIWTGFDHVLFLLALLMPAVLRREGGHWRAVGLAEACAGTLKVVTAFTVAHSITLSLAALGMVALPARLVESAIAASVAIAALNNAYPIFRDRSWLVGFAFGLLHGFGFASVLADLSLPSSSLSVALLGFNVGVESGQLVIVAAFLPLAYLLRRSWMYQRFTLIAASAAIALLAAVWFVERALDIHVLTV